jgi:hypothetical protein
MSPDAAICISCGKSRKPRRGRTPIRQGLCASCKQAKRQHCFSCQTCGQQVATVKNPGRPRKYCSRRCRELAQAKIVKKRRRSDLRESGKTLPGDQLRCAVVKCQKQFTAKTSHQKYCSDKCRQAAAWGPYATGEVVATRIRFQQCPRCAALVVVHGKGFSPKKCQSCRREVLRHKDARKNHARRASGRDLPSVEQLAARDGSRCQICRRQVDLGRSGHDAWGPTIDHILPVSRGGTNDSANLRLVHRRCNLSRGNRQPAQMLIGVA